MLSESGIEYVRGAISRDEADAIADRVWEYYAATGVRRDDAATWPSNPLIENKLQRLRKTGAFAAFGNGSILGKIAAVLGQDWLEKHPLGSPLIMNCADHPRFMVTHTAYGAGGGGTDGNSS